MVSFSKPVEYICFPFAIAYWRLMLIGKSWICSGESASEGEGTSEGSDANSQNVSSGTVLSFLLCCQYVSINTYFAVIASFKGYTITTKALSHIAIGLG